MKVKHGYRIERANETLTIVRDTYENHSVLLDPTTLEPIEDDPDELVRHAYFMTLIGGRWMVSNIYRAEDVHVTYETAGGS